MDASRSKPIPVSTLMRLCLLILFDTSLCKNPNDDKKKTRGNSDKDSVLQTKACVQAMANNKSPFPDSQERKKCKQTPWQR